MNKLSNFFLGFLCLPGAITSALIYGVSTYGARNQISVLEDLKLKEKLTDAIAPLSTFAWVAIFIFWVFNYS